MSPAFLRGLLICGYLTLASHCLPASLPPCLPASLPPCLLASLPPCLPASLPPCLLASLLSLPLSASLCLPLPPFASICLSITLHCVVRVRYCCTAAYAIREDQISQSQHFHDTMHHSLAFLHNCRHHQGESDLKRWPLSPSSLCRVVYRGTLSGIEP